MKHGEKKQEILRLSKSHRPALIHKIVGCRREYVYKILKECEVPIERPDYLGRAISNLEKHLKYNDGENIKQALKLIRS